MITNEFDTDCGKYTIKSHGNGWGYEVFCNITGDNLWFQDHDADQLQTDTNNFEDTTILSQYFENLYNWAMPEKLDNTTILWYNISWLGKNKTNPISKSET